ncbi:hypothetical protein AMS68_002083 [Peltaster fructicola]|uniref:Zn(2)-C6 fungal-type domain-containing protein n=1 Tax=Peltaster fructicola TaxID=286661 RepID=A0A6H0XPF6_9PEZI|nr:hypothetical protein AMS68_002083 [Peltaster fructicola]
MTGAGPSRRSHTKSRTGCKTCKRRHIRCDELFPQCRNCTKHQVRCDYMDTADAETSSQRSSSIDERSITLSPSIEDEIDAWKQSGVFPFPNLHVYPPPQVHDLSKDDLRLIYHICSVCSDLAMSETSNLAGWTEKIPKFLSIASSFRFVMHAILSFAANHLAWVQTSTDLRSLQVQHGSIALRGLHDAIGNFSPANADAILSASMLMCWQATDWLSWSSLLSGMQSVMTAMPPQNRDRFLADVFPRETTESHRSVPIHGATLQERAHILQDLVNALELLQVALLGHDLESHWIDQLLQYVHRLQTVPPASTPEQQFQHAYMLRKWAFWVPISLLRRQSSRGPAVLVLAHLYAAMTALQPLFPDLHPNFYSDSAPTITRVVLPPLQAIIQATDAMQASQGGASAAEITSLMQYVKRIVGEYQSQHSPNIYVHPFAAPIPMQAGDISPAFVPALQNPPTVPSSTYLDVPYEPAGFTHVTDNWGVVPSPGFPPLRQDSFGSYDSAEELYPVDHIGTSRAYPQHRPSQ